MTLLPVCSFHSKQVSSQYANYHVSYGEEVPTFLVAGHETTSTETMWALYTLAQYPAIQQKLREELLTVPTDTPDMDDLNALPYLDAVTRETLRIHAAVPSTIRVAMKDDIIPVSEPYYDKKGQVHKEIRYAQLCQCVRGVYGLLIIE